MGKVVDIDSEVLSPPIVETVFGDCDFLIFVVQPLLVFIFQNIVAVVLKSVNILKLRYSYVIFQVYDN